MLKIALISPKGPLYRHKTGIFRKDLRAAPLTLTTLASLIPAELNAEVKLYDEGVEALPERIEADLIGMTVITGSAPRCYELAAHFRRQGITVVLGGPHVTLVPEDASPHADCIVTGYAEETWPQLLKDFSRGELKPRYSMDPEFSFTRLPTIPFPRRDLLKAGSYKTINTFEATRGCIHKCDFCVVPTAWGRRPFQKPVGHIVDDIKQTGAKKIVFYDLNLLADFVYTKELFRALIPLKIKWFGLSTVLIGKDQELLDLAHRSGCVGLLIGFESLSPASMLDYNKRFNQPREYSELIKELHSRRIAINGTFVFGSDSDDEHSFEHVSDFVFSNRIDLPRFSLLTPFPGTPLFKNLERQERILTRDWSLYDGQHVVFEPKKMSAAALLQSHERIWRKVYSYGSIWHRVKPSFSTFPILLGANIAYRFYANNLARFYNCQGGVA